MKNLITCAAAVALAGPAMAGTIDPGLEEVIAKTNGEEIISTIVVMLDRVDLDALTLRLNRDGASNADRHFAVVTALQDRAAATQGDLAATLEAMLHQGLVEDYRAAWINNCFRVDAAPDVIEFIAQRDDVDVVYFNYPIELIDPVEVGPVSHGGSPTDTPEPGIVAVRAPEVWAMGFTGTGVLVSSLDTGVDGNHPALASRWRGLDPAYAGHPEWAWFDPIDPNSTFPYADGSHGTHTMGSVCGGAPGDEVGVAPGAQWIHAATIDRDTLWSTIWDSIDAYQWLIDPDGNPATFWDVPQVNSNSWGIATWHNVDPYNVPCDDGFWASLDACEAAGIVILFSAGNEGPGSNSLRRPSDRATDEFRTCAVASVDANVPSWPISGFSSRGPTYCTPGGDPAIKPDISAPGDNVRSAVPGGGYSTMSGTSMASPHVNGVVALMREACPDLSVQEIKEIIYLTAYDLGSTGEDNNYGWGMIDAYEAVNMALDWCGPSPPRAYNGYVETHVDEAVSIELIATDHDGGPQPIQWIVDALPATGATLTDEGNGHVIAAGELPYTLVNNGNFVTYTPFAAYYGSDEFVFSATDGGTPPTGGVSDPATVTVIVQFDPPVITSSVLPDGYLNAPYGPVQLQVDEGQPPMEWSLISDLYTEVDLGASNFAAVGVERNWHADDGSWNYTLPFPFPYYDNLFTSVNVCSNGFLDFASTSSAWSNSTQEMIDNVRICALWDDLRTDQTAGDDIYIDESIAGQVTIRWQTVTYSAGTPCNHACTLYQDGRIEFHYGSGNGGLTPTVGISKGDGVNYLLSMYDGQGQLGNANSVQLYQPTPLPDGLMLTPAGAITGTPLEFGAFAPRVRVIDALGRSDSAELALTILESGTPGDVNGDGVVDVQDLLAVLSAWGACGGCPEDVNGDGVVDVLDLLTVLSNWT